MDVGFGHTLPVRNDAAMHPAINLPEVIYLKLLLLEFIERQRSIR